MMQSKVSTQKNPVKRRKVIHYRKNCIGCGMCAFLCPKYWKLSEKDGLADLKNAIQVKDVFQKEIEFGDEKENEDAAKNCPVNIIKISA